MLSEFARWFIRPSVLFLIASYGFHYSAAEVVPTWPPPVNIELNLSSDDPSIQFIVEGMQFSLVDDLDNSIRALRTAAKMNPAAVEPSIQLSLALCTLRQDPLASTEAKRAFSAATRSSTADDELGYVETLRERQGEGRCCRLPMLFPSATVVQEDLDAYTDHCR